MVNFSIMKHSIKPKSALNSAAGFTCREYFLDDNEMDIEQSFQWKGKK